MWRTWPNQCRQFHTSLSPMSCTLAHLNTSSLLTKWSHFMFYIRHRYCCRFVQSCIISCWYKVHISLPYIRRGMKHWLYTFILVKVVKSCELDTLFCKHPKAHDAACIQDVSSSFMEQSLMTKLLSYLKQMPVANLAPSIKKTRCIANTHSFCFNRIDSQTHTISKVIVGCQKQLQALWCVSKDCDVISILSLSDKICEDFSLCLKSVQSKKITMVTESDPYTAHVLDFVES